MGLEGERADAIAWLVEKMWFKKLVSFGRSMRVVYHHPQWLSDPRTKVAHLGRLTRTAAASSLWDACGGFVAVVCRRGTSIGLGLRNCPKTS